MPGKSKIFPKKKIFSPLLWEQALNWVSLKKEKGGKRKKKKKEEENGRGREERGREERRKG